MASPTKVTQFFHHRCSTGISGRNVVQECRGRSCIARQCRRDSKTGLLEPKCTFIPDKSQTAKDSIMFMQSLDSVSWVYILTTGTNVHVGYLCNTLVSSSLDIHLLPCAAFSKVSYYFSHLAGVRLYLTVAFICTYLMVTDHAHLFIYLPAIACISWKIPIWIISWFLIMLLLGNFCHWILWVF